MKGLVGIAVLTLAASCSDQLAAKDQSAVIEGDLTGIRYAESYGFCAGRCVRELSIASTGEATLVVRDRPGEPALSEQSFTLPAGDRDRLFDLAGASAGEPWEARYGCPDCADQGQFDLTVAAGTAEMSTVLDPAHHPAQFDELLAELKQILVREL